MSHPKVTFDLRVVHLSSNPEPYALMLRLEKQNRKISKAIRAKTQRINFLLNLKKGSDMDSPTQIIPLVKIATNPHLIFII